jgi:hypothetical protein
MEHRWGHRIGVDLPVRITGNPFSVRAGRLVNLSVSGAFILTGGDLRKLSRVLIVIANPSMARHEAPTLAAYVARKLGDGFGIEWCEFAPVEVTRMLQSLTSRRHNSLHKAENPAAVAIARISTPLLKHKS